MPIIHPDEFNIGFHYIEGSPPRGMQPEVKITLEGGEKKVIGDRLYYKFLIEGPHVILLNIIPNWNAKLVKWNLKPRIEEILDFEPPYILHLTYADTQVNHTLELYFTVS